VADPADEVSSYAAEGVSTPREQTNGDHLHQHDRANSRSGPHTPGRDREGCAAKCQMDADEHDGESDKNHCHEGKSPSSGSCRLAPDRSRRRGVHPLPPHRQPVAPTDLFEPATDE